MNKLFKYLCLVLCIFSFSIFNVSAKSNKEITIYFFHGDGCPHCAAEEEYLKKVEKKYSNVKIIRYEVWYNEENSSFLNKVMSEMSVDTTGVPFTVIGSTPTVGFSDEVTSNKLDRIIDFYLDNYSKYTDVVSLIKDDKYTKKQDDQFLIKDKESDESTTISVPFFGSVNLKSFSIPTAASLIGLVDGFNPCAMWVLLFLISMLLGMKDRKRMWILGLTFLISSALVYMLIMLSWFNVVVNITTSIVMRNIIAIIAIVGSVLNIRSYFKESDSGCTVTDSKKRKKILEKIQKFTHEKSFLFAMLGVVGLAVSVNVIELACSAGLPLVFTQILAINKVSGFMAFLYTLLYIFFFLIDDIIVFVIAMKTMKITAISTKYNKYSHLIGGIIMLLIGGLLIFKPEWLMFNFK